MRRGRQACPYMVELGYDCSSVLSVLGRAEHTCGPVVRRQQGDSNPGPSALSCLGQVLLPTERPPTL